MKDLLTTVVENVEIAENIFRIVLKSKEKQTIKCGQFAQVKLPDGEFLLRRPFCISDFDNVEGSITMIYQVKGEGTACLSRVSAGQSLQCLYPLGNGFELGESDKKVVLLGGGMGSVILPSVVREYPDKTFFTYMGFADKNLIVCDSLEEKSEKFVVTTDNGSNGNKGFATDRLLADLDEIKPDIILSCGPEPMYVAMQRTFLNCGVPIKVSLEGRMGCGFGACLVCACKIKKHGEEKILRVCKDGPVFDLFEVEL